MTTCAALTPSVLTIDPEATSQHIEASIRDAVFKRMRRRGVVVGISGGIDSSAVAALAARALGADKVIGLMLPETDSSPDSTRLAQTLADRLGIRSFVEDVTGILDAAVS